MKHYSEHQLSQIRSIDLLTYLKNYEPEELVKFSRDTYVTKTHDSLKISNGKWYWFSRGIGGVSALDYLIKVKNYNFNEAVKTIQKCINNCEPIKYVQIENNKNTKLILPQKNENNNMIIQYLLSRGIDRDLIYECIDNDLIYEEAKTHNVVFVGYDKHNSPRYAYIRSTNSIRFIKEAYGSHKAFSFKIKSLNNSNTIHIFESAIDLLSYATILKLNNKEWYNENLLSLAGVYQPTKIIQESKIPISLNLFLNNNPNINKIILHLDNDIAGRTATESLKITLQNRYEVIDEPAQYGKDINDYLCAKLGIININKCERDR